jgi:hypothetical protein
MKNKKGNQSRFFLRISVGACLSDGRQRQEVDPRVASSPSGGGRAALDLRADG